MANISGTNLAASIVPFTTDDKFATHLAQYGKGGWRSVDTIADRDAITDRRLEVGMSVYVTSENKLYILAALDTATTPYTKTWEEFKSGSTDSVRKTSSFDNFEPLIPGEIIQYVGETNQNYTKGYFYKVTSETTPEELQVAGTSSSTLMPEDITIDSNVWSAEVTTAGTYIFNYNGTNWSLDNIVVDLAIYGITIDSSAIVSPGDNFEIVYTPEETTYTWSQINVQPHTNLVWGNITGTLSDQTDLQTALNNKSQVIFKLIVEEESK